MTNERLGAAIKAEAVTVLATPAARMLLIASLVMAGVSLTANSVPFDDLGAPGVLRGLMHASTVATLIFAMVAGVYSATTDFRFGLVDQRVLNQPLRQVVLGAKAITAGIIGLVYGCLGAVVAAVVGSILFSQQGASFDVGSEVVARALIGLVVAAPLFAIIGVAIGTILRNQPTAVGGSLAWLLIVEPAAILGLPAVGKWLPGAAGLALTYSPDDILLSQVAGGLLLTGFATVLSAVAFARFGSADL